MLLNIDRPIIIIMKISAIIRNQIQVFNENILVYFAVIYVLYFHSDSIDWRDSGVIFTYLFDKNIHNVLDRKLKHANCRMHT